MVAKANTSSSGVKRPPHGQNAWSVFEQRKALARLRASLMDEASNRRPRPQGRVYTDFTQSPFVSD